MGAHMRRENWPSILAEYLREMKGAEFVWGELDCCLFAADFVERITGVDHAAPFRGKYHTAAGAAKALKKYGQGDLVSTMDATLNSCCVLCARRGDIVAHKFSAGVALGVCDGARSWFLQIGGGLVSVPTFSCSHAWSVS